MSNIYIGTSGFSYEDWKGFFYPESINQKEFLSYYCTIFNTVELNFTYYRFPEDYFFLSMFRNVSKSKNFLFSVKANQIFTHQRKYIIGDIKKFTDALQPLIERKKLGSILFQFPYSFIYNQQNLNYLKQLLYGFRNCEKSVEFRHLSWLNKNTFDCLNDNNSGFCNVDEPNLSNLLPATEILTSENGYIRFHGRNSKYWWKSNKSYQRYDYMYKQNELIEWVPKIVNMSEKSKKIYIYFNNHYKGKAPASALMLLDLLKSSGLKI